MTDMNKINFEALESVTGGKDVQVKNPSSERHRAWMLLSNANSITVTGLEQPAER